MLLGHDVCAGIETPTKTVSLRPRRAIQRPREKAIEGKQLHRRLGLRTAEERKEESKYPLSRQEDKVTVLRKVAG